MLLVVVVVKTYRRYDSDPFIPGGQQEAQQEDGRLLGIQGALGRIQLLGIPLARWWWER